MLDAYAGQTFRCDFESHGFVAEVCPKNKSDLYEVLEPVINAGEVELLDEVKLQEQLLTLVLRGSKIDHEPGGHDDYSQRAGRFGVHDPAGGDGLQRARMEHADRHVVWPALLPRLRHYGGGNMMRVVINLPDLRGKK